ncbi:MAG: hypothetical protein R3282_00475, partial [Rhodothermales bacterium]|nr:hypothetical protein [Rhodothermales bacterium]
MASILLAFGIDAGWDMRQAAHQDRQLLQALVSEIEGNQEELRLRSSQGASARRAHAKLIDLIGPQPEIVSVDSLSELLRSSMAFGVVEIESAALDAL